MMAGRIADVPGAHRGQPLAAGLIAFGMGLLAASLIPPSQWERQLAGQAKHEAMERTGGFKQNAGAMARQVQSNLRQPAMQTARSVAAEAPRACPPWRSRAGLWLAGQGTGPRKPGITATQGRMRKSR